ncbi:MAG TPA: hypothetical protein DD640_00135 [Clostridiales bacterium]|nr:hypothetical protein [Clostridiales bacterium]
MRRYLIPRTDLWAAPVCLGTGGFTIEQEQQARDQLDRFIDLGGNLIDTANVYGRKKPGHENQSEQILGRWLQDRGQPSDLLISSKGGHPSPEDMHRSRLDPASLAADLDSSRISLGRDCIDLYFLHRDDPDQPVEALLSQLELFRQSGKIRCYGLSNWTADRLEQALAWSRQQTSSGLAALQNRWSLARFNPEGTTDDTLAEVDGQIWAILAEENLALLAYSALAKGFFSKILPDPASAPQTDAPEENSRISMTLDAIPEKLRRYYENELNNKRAQAVFQLTASKKARPAQIALAWMLHQPFPVFPIVAFSSLKQLDEAMGAPALHLIPDDMDRLAAGSVY